MGEIIFAILASLFLVMCSGAAVSNDNDLSEINFPGFFLPDSKALLDSDADPKPCCLPTKWQGDVTSQVGWSARQRGFREQTMSVYVNEDDKKMAGKGKCCNDTCGFLVVFGANNTADFYQYKVGSKKCFHRKAEHAEFRKQCIPDNATFGGSVKIGPASSGLGVNIWKFHGKTSHRDAANLQIFVSGRALVTPDTCLPVVFQDHGLFRNRRGGETSESVKFQMAGDDEMEMMQEFDDDVSRPKPHPRPGHRGGAFIGSAFYSNVETSIKDPSVFTPPDYCKSISSDLKYGDDMEYPDIVDRFVILK